MHKITFLILALSFSTAAQSQIVINELRPGGAVELKNIGSEAVNISGYFLCNFPAYQEIIAANLDCGNTTIGAGELLTVNDFQTLMAADGEMGLYMSNNFASSAAMVDYVEWGSSGHTRASVAIDAGIWSSGDFAMAMSAAQSLEYSGAGDGSEAWGLSDTSTLCAENSNAGTGTCDADGGTIAGGPYEFCINAFPDVITDIILSGATGANMRWVVTEPDGLIVSVQDEQSDLDFNQAPPGTCLIYHISYEGDATGIVSGNNLSDITGCHDLSNAIEVVRNRSIGGSTGGGVRKVCIDGEPDFITDITVTGNEGENSTWLITDQDLNILGIPMDPSMVNFDANEAGTCLVWHLSYADGIQGLEMGANAAELQGCFGLSDAVFVVRVEDNNVAGTVSSAGPYEICVNGEADFITDLSVEGASGDAERWITTDTDLNILAVSTDQSTLNLDLLPGADLQIWHIVFSSSASGIGVGNNVADIEGCYAVSNPIDVARLIPDGGQLSGGPYSFCINGFEDRITDLSIDGFSGANGQWLVTDLSGGIIGLPAEISDVDFDMAEPGDCLVWYISYEDGLSGLELGALVSNLDGCFDLSNSVMVERIEGTELGGVLTGGPYEFCIDGEPDFITDLELSGEQGDNSRYLVTDEELNIIEVLSDPSTTDFDQTGQGLSLIWHISYSNNAAGLTPGNNVADIAGCFALSNSIDINRMAPEGGTLSGGPYEVCVNGTPDFIIDILLEGNVGGGSGWIVTDEDLLILGLPEDPAAVDFDAAGVGNCLVWHIAFGGDVGGLELGANAAELTGCFALSNAITVNRIANANVGGNLSGGPFSFCIDGEADNVSGVTVSGNEGESAQWLVTDTDGEILGLPGAIEDVDFDDAGDGTCLIWHLSHDLGLEGLIVGENVSDLVGCYALSDSIVVERSAVVGGVLSGGPYEFCIDGEADNVTDLELSDAFGSNIGWVITEEDLTIIDIPDDIATVDFDGAEAGICLIWSIAYEEGITGLEVGANAGELDGCFALSTSVSVTRSDTAPICPDGITENSLGAIEVYPNPAHDLIRFNTDIDLSDEAVVSLLTADGKGVVSMSINALLETGHMDISKLEEGYYLLQIRDKNRLSTSAISVVR